MQDIVYDKKIYFLPDKWNELTGKQIIAVAALLHNSKYNTTVKELLLLRALLNISDYNFGKLHVDGKKRMLPYIEWIADSENILTENNLPSYRKNIFSKRLYGAASSFGNMTMVEFHYTEVAYKYLLETNEEKYLDELVAILYRCKKENYDTRINSDGDVRVSFKPAAIDYHKKVVSKWKPKVKQAILMWYDGCRQELVKEYKDVYSGKESDANYYAGLYTMIRSLAGEKYGTIEKIEQLNVHTAHLECSILLEEKQEQERQLKANGSI